MSNVDLPNSVLSRRDLLGKTVAIALAAAVTPTAPTAPTAPIAPTAPAAPPKYSVPEFKMGDLVAYDWEPDDDDAPEFATDFGEILGMRWVPKPDYHCLIADTWVYFVRWTHGTCGPETCYPCYDGEPTLASDLRLVV